VWSSQAYIGRSTSHRGRPGVDSRVVRACIASLWLPSATGWELLALHGALLIGGGRLGVFEITGAHLTDALL
jgi:hypothetical protein